MADNTEGKLTTVRDPDMISQELETPRMPLVSGGLGTLRLSDEQRAILEEPIPMKDLDILPTGEVYASQVQYRRRLTAVFGPGGWAMVEYSQPKIDHNIVMQKWALYAQGSLISTAWGEQEYFPQNTRMSYATALESAKSNALMRCCKDLSIASECWDRHFTEEFKREFCTEVIVQNYQGGGARKQWRRKDANTFYNEKVEMPSIPPPPSQPPPKSVQQQQPVQQPQPVSKPVEQPSPVQQPLPAAEKAGGASQAGSSSSFPPKQRSKQPAPSAEPKQTEFINAPAEPKLSPEKHKKLLQEVMHAAADASIICSMFHVPDLASLNDEQYDAVMEILVNKINLEKPKAKEPPKQDELK